MTNIDLILFYGEKSYCYRDGIGISNLERIIKHECTKRKDDCLVTTSEFLYKIEEVLKNAGRLEQLSRESGCSIFLTPENFAKWDIRKKELTNAGIEVETEKGPVCEFWPDSIGFYFSPESNAFAFPKRMTVDEVHLLPNTCMGALICSEIYDVGIRPIQLNGIKILLNPANNIMYMDDMLKGRTMLLAGMGTDADAFRECGYIVRARNEDETKKFIMDAPSKHSCVKLLQEKGVLLVRCEYENSSGIVNDLPNLRVSNVSYNKEYARLEIEI